MTNEPTPYGACRLTDIRAENVFRHRPQGSPANEAGRVAAVVARLQPVCMSLLRSSMQQRRVHNAAFAPQTTLPAA